LIQKNYIADAMAASSEVELHAETLAGSTMVFVMRKVEVTSSFAAPWQMGGENGSGNVIMISRLGNSAHIDPQKSRSARFGSRSDLVETQNWYFILPDVSTAMAW
jgi:hypothetical protein